MAAASKEEEVGWTAACGRKGTAASVSRGAAVLVKGVEPHAPLLLREVLHLRLRKMETVEVPPADSKNSRD